jgi:hypothetical protein
MVCGHTVPATNSAEWRFTASVSSTTRKKKAESFWVMPIEMSDDQSHE